MFIEEQVLSAGITSLVRHHVAQNIFNFFSNIANGPDSITRAGNISNFQIPMIFSDDIPRDHAEELAKAAEVKLAWDIKQYCELLIQGRPSDVSLYNIVSKIPITIINKRANVDKDLSSRFSVAGINIINDMNAAPDVNVRFSESVDEYAQEFAKVIPKPKDGLFAEATKVGDTSFTSGSASATRIEIKINYVTGNESKIENVTYVISVQCTPRYVNSAELMSRFSAYDNRHFYRQMVKLEKNEISFFTGLLLDLKTVVNKAKYAASRNKDPIFETIDKFSLLKDMMMNVCPFLMMCISSDVKRKLLSDQYMDIKKDVKDVLKSFCAMGLFIYTPEGNKVDMYYDGDAGWTEYTLDAVITDTNRYSREIRELIKFNKH